MTKGRYYFFMVFHRSPNRRFHDLIHVPFIRDFYILKNDGWGSHV